MMKGNLNVQVPLSQNFRYVRVQQVVSGLPNLSASYLQNMTILYDNH